MIDLSQEIFLLVGVPACGKSWVIERLKSKYDCVCHDDYIDRPKAYVPAIIRTAMEATRPVLCEAPFSMNRIIEPLHDQGFAIKPVFIIESESVLADRYRQRGRDEESIICGHLNRQKTFKSRIGEYQAFSGNSQDVLMHLSMLASERNSSD